MVICLERRADLHMAQLMSLPLTVSCFSKIQIGFAFLVPADMGSPGQRAVKRVCVCACALPWKRHVICRANSNIHVCISHISIYTYVQLRNIAINNQCVIIQDETKYCNLKFATNVLPIMGRSPRPKGLERGGLLGRS